jgi:hypothetical protein
MTRSTLIPSIYLRAVLVLHGKPSSLVSLKEALALYATMDETSGGSATRKYRGHRVEKTAHREVSMKDELVARRVAGVTAILSGAAQVSWAVLNGVTQGGLDSGGASPQVVRIGQILLISWNLLLLPVALFLGTWLKSKSPYLVMLYTVCGIVSFLLWALNSPVMEFSWILLSAIWWTGIGFVLRSELRVLGIFTIVVGIAALLDGIITLLTIPPPLFYGGALKIPFSLIWEVWIGIMLLLPVKRKVSHLQRLPVDIASEANP